MKKIFIKTLCLILLFSLFGCAKKPIQKNSMGYDFSKLNVENVVFNFYHSNTKDHHFERIHTFKAPVKKDCCLYLDTKIREETIILFVEQIFEQSINDGISFKQDTLETFEYTVPTFNGRITGWQDFEIFNTKKEQLFRLYPLSNNEGSIYFNTISLDKPYDIENANIDNILVTIQLQ